VTGGLRDSLVRLLPLDARDQRAIDEVLADWRHEEHRASTAGPRLVVHLRFACATLGALMHIALRQIAQPRAGAIAGAAAAWIAAPYLALGLAGLVPFDTGSEAGLLHTLASLLSFGTLFLPLALFASVQLRSDQSPPALGLACVAFLVLLLTVGWVQPELNQLTREMAYAARGGTGIVSRGLAELTFGELLWEASAARSPWMPLIVTSMRLSLAFAVPAAVILAARSAACYPKRRWTVTVLAFPAYFVLVGAAFSGTWSHWVELAQPWLLPAALVAATVGLAGRSFERFNATG